MVQFQWGFFRINWGLILSYGTFLLVNFYHFLKWYHFAANILHFSEMLPFLVAIFIILWNGTILFLTFSTRLEWYYFCRKGKFSSFSEIVPLLSRIFGTLLEWYHYCRGLSALS